MGWFSDVLAAVRTRLGLDRPGASPLEPVPPGQLATVDALVARMREIDAGLPAGDGVRAFSDMYLRVTELVRDRIGQGWFRDAATMTRLDLVFAGLWLEAVAAPTPTDAWLPLFESRSRTDVLAIQFAVAGMNAHINHDLPIAVVRTCRQLGLRPDSPGLEEDYQRVTGLLAEVQDDVRRSFLDGLALEVDRRVAGPVADLVGAWSIGRARDAAWTNAGVLWSLEGVEPLRTDYLATLSRTVGLASRQLLTPVAGPQAAAGAAT
ncbi:DUF5995 family protein [Intrasporangium sp. YIM S08009]|uniref:DUF5995 family protein n=1 Tax=Intrasporangium zincisolvens TaxID=3080018 RepID=UPI002B05B2F0|nr:DUF5995 family protein [Intrasporangium sp. YIM S08009]